MQLVVVNSPDTSGAGRRQAVFSSLELPPAGGATRFFSARVFNIALVLIRRLIFCLRRRLNRALSPLTPDITVSPVFVRAMTESPVGAIYLALA
jgi:hypothetical protein